mmetsp:Transcript_69471/g.137362  ORF Transcript_69471/g.137362 Transcript_69471/m.137362 type:complete len:353 (+) Transcript_69471:125-1183(+)|eukprot:CAMPEP_0172716696 /NCGR_PEP_ID=MMETSP1074-20121228/69226_1 /TAXON_ID=2916 /ORGANISM="Ceratium fusus, Strain PA161109" /LENGTH=352 /DNA_ID=CAMNT_0013541461 /DNA_START=117 /DNA_END=1175 /DNA_ORIENTATION=+
MNAVVILLAVMLLMNTSWYVAVMLIFGVILFFIVNIIMRQESMLYVPCVLPGVQKPSDNPEGLRSPSDRGLTYEDVVLETADKLRIHAWFIPIGEGSEQAPTILFFHANAGNIGLRVPNFAHIVEKLHANIFALDYRGYGHSDGTPSEDGLIEDAICAWRWLCDAGSAGRLDVQRVFVFGRSLGGAVAVALAHELQERSKAKLSKTTEVDEAETPLRPCGIILENTFVSISAVVDALFPLLAFKSLKARFLRLRWETVNRIATVQVPFLFLTGEKDEMIPPWHSKHLHQQAKLAPMRRRVVFPEGSHNDTWERGGDLYWTSQEDFIRDCVAGDFSKQDVIRDATAGDCSKKT